MAEIDHVVVLALENRSFDHMLGFLEHPDPSFEGCRRGGPFTNPGWDGGASVAASSDARPVLPCRVDHSHDAVMEQLGMRGTGRAGRPTNQGFVVNLERTARGLDPPEYAGLLGPLRNLLSRRAGAPAPPGAGLGPLAMRCHPPESVPALSTLALEFAVCTRWHCSVPGETWPNRNFMHAATSDGETNIERRFYENPTIFELLERHGVTWRIYHDDTPQAWAFPHLWDTEDRHANWYRFSDFLEHAREGDLPAYAFIEPNHRPPLHTLDHDPLIGTPDVSDNQHPENNQVDRQAYERYAVGGPGPDTDFARGDRLIATIYEALRTNPALFERTILLVTYDEHGGLYDHVPPPTGVPAPGTHPTLGTRIRRALLHRRAARFDFTMLGPRVPTVVVSPFIARATVDAQVHDHASIPATLRSIFAPPAAPLTRRDAWAARFDSVLTLARPRRDDLPDLSAHVLASVPPGPPPESGSTAVPHYYGDFVRQAENVMRRLRRVREPEAAGVNLPAAPRARGAQVTDVFLSAARRHRRERSTDGASPAAPARAGNSRRPPR